MTQRQSLVEGFDNNCLNNAGNAVGGITIVLDNPAANYFAGQEVKGVIKIQILKDIKVRGILVQIRGDCNVYWTNKNERSGKVSMSENRNFRNHQPCFCWTHFFAGNLRSIVRIAQGAHEFEFAYTLPLNVPSSFEGEHGNIRYSVMAQLSWPGCIYFEQILQVITVNSLINLNKDPVKTKSPGEKELVYRQVFKQTGLRLKLSVPRTGYVPGQTVIAHATVENRTLHKVRCVRSEIVEVCTYIARDQERATKRVVASSNTGKIGRGVRDTWFIYLDIPPVPPTGLKFCNIINLEYYVRLTVYCNKLPKQRVSVPLTIGTIPLNEDLGSFDGGQTGAPSPGDMPTQMTAEHPSLTNAVFAESVWGKAELSTNQRRVSQSGKQFAPNYVMYRCNSGLGNSKGRSVVHLRTACPDLDEAEEE